MPRFDFVTDAAFRKTLEDDYREMSICVKNASWKSVHILAGSIIEAVLLDLIDGLPNPPTRLLQFGLDDLTSHCRQKGLISGRAADLSAVVRSYRNLIHPGRMIRLKETISPSGANIAASLVEMIIEEVEQKKIESS